MSLLAYLEKRIPEYLHETRNDYLEWYVDGIYMDIIHIHIKHPDAPGYVYKHTFGGPYQEGWTYAEIFIEFKYKFEGWTECYWDWYWHWKSYSQQMNIN